MSRSKMSMQFFVVSEPRRRSTSVEKSQYLPWPETLLSYSVNARVPNITPTRCVESGKVPRTKGIPAQAFHGYHKHPNWDLNG